MFLPPDLVGDYEEARQEVSEVLADFEALPDDFKTYRSSNPSFDLAPAVEQALNLVRLAQEFILKIANAPWPSEDDPGVAHSAYEEFILAIISIKDAVKGLRFGLPIIMPVEGKATLDVKTSTARSLQFKLPTLPTVLPDALASYLKIVEASDLRPSEKAEAQNFTAQWRQRLEIQDLVAETVEARNSAVEAQQVARRAAGVVGEVKLSEHFGNYARQEAATANLLRYAVIAALVALSVGLFWATKDVKNLNSISLTKLSLSIPLGVLAGYLARESSKHREKAQWAASLEVQLLTFDAFSSPLSEEARETHRLEFGSRIFGSNNDSSVGQMGGVDSQSTMNEAASLLGAVSELLKKVTGGVDGKKTP